MQRKKFAVVKNPKTKRGMTNKLNGNIGVARHVAIIQHKHCTS